MDIKTSIINIFKEIQNYKGNFGDPIVEYVDFDPIQILRSEPSKFIKTGACIGLLVNFSNHIDNSTFEDAKNGKSALDIELALNECLCSQIIDIKEALESSKNSEVNFYKILQKIYTNHIESFDEKCT